MTEPDRQQLRKLFELVDIHKEIGGSTEALDDKLADHWFNFRENHGLAISLDLVRQYATEQKR